MMGILVDRFIYQGLRQARAGAGPGHDNGQAIPATVGPSKGVAARLGLGS
jgi:hypothetical protein